MELDFVKYKISVSALHRGTNNNSCKLPAGKKRVANNYCPLPTLQSGDVNDDNCHMYCFLKFAAGFSKFHTFPFLSQHQ